MQDTDQRRARAETIYARFLARRDAGGDEDLAALAETHADLAAELRAADAAWRQARGIYAALSASRDAAAAASEALAESVLAGRSGSDSLSGKVLRQLQARPPSGSRYEPVEEIARGGMGAVLKVWDPDLRRHLAMKVASLPEGGDRASASDHERALARFLEEAQITGQLDHPGIVPVHELGLDASGRVYFTMQLVRGQDLGQVFHMAATGAQGWSTTRAVRVVLSVCEAMAYAHSKGVIHRDLKPANVMVGRFGEVYVMDWGLARVVGHRDTTRARLATASTSIHMVRTDRRDARESGHGGSAASTLDGDVLGTPAYMPPEQANGQIDALDERSDVYAVGAILYHLLAGHMPYVRPGGKRDAYQVWSAVRTQAPEPLQEIAPKAPPELVAICEKAMARPRDERYSSMADLAGDLSAYLDGHVVRAYETGAVAEFRKWVRRNRGTALASVAALVATLGGLGAYVYVQDRANEQLTSSNARLLVATEAARRSEARARDEADRADANAKLAEAKSREAEARAREATRERDAADRVVEFLAHLLRSPDPEMARGATVTVKEILDRGALTVAHDMEEDPLVGSRLMDAMGGAYLALGLYSDAEPLLVRAYEERRDHLGPESRDTLRSRRALGGLYSDLGRYADARRELEATAQVAERALSAGDPDTLVTLSELGELAYREGLYPASEELHLRALEGLELALGPVHAWTLRACRELAQLYRRMDRLDEAEELYRRVWDGLLESVGADHPETLLARRDLAGNLLFQGRLDEARALFQETLAEMRRVLSDDHPDTLICWNDLADLSSRRGDLRAARREYEAIVPRYAAVFGPSHSSTLTVRSNLAGVLYRLGELDAAEALLEETLAASEAERGATHPRTYATANGLAVVYAAQGRLDEAEPLFLAALEGLREAQGEGHSEVREVLRSLVEVYERAGRLDEAVRRMRELLEATPPDTAEHEAAARRLQALEARQERGG